MDRPSLARASALAAELDRYLDAAGEQRVDLGLLGDLAG
jgi:hypothetical protein